MNKNVLLKELDLIKSPLIKEWTKATLQNVPDYFFYGMASSTGKYHPACTCQKGGLLIHVKRAVYFANRLCDGWGIKGIDHDIVISAVILHDIAKVPSPKEDPKITYADYENHPINAEKYFAMTPQHVIDLPEEIYHSEPKREYQLIRDCIRHHMGLWTPASIKKSLADYTQLELLVYTADYMAATKI
jgi:23S rRNA maturation-related 3'-5' exoribonuclease YhaM